ncbi:MAG: cache domain-containing protein, partial [bacterium]|nr:cache domain-containing protein [bacterium]
MPLLVRLWASTRDTVNSVRGRLVLLTISLLIPTLLSSSFLLASANLKGRAQVDQQLMTTARALSAAMDRQTAAGLAVAETLASDQALQAGDWDTVHARALRVTGQRKGWLVLTDATGQQVVNTLKPVHAPLPRSQRAPEMAKAFSERRSQISNLRPGQVAKGFVITVATPVVIKGQPYMLAYVADSATFSDLMRQQRAPAGWVITLLDGNHKIIARSVNNARWTGQDATSEQIGYLKRSNEGVRLARSLEGVSSLVAYTRSPQSGWTLLVDVPRASLANVMTGSMLRATGVFV